MEMFGVLIVFIGCPLFIVWVCCALYTVSRDAKSENASSNNEETKNNNTETDIGVKRLTINNNSNAQIIKVKKIKKELHGNGTITVEINDEDEDEEFEEIVQKLLKIENIIDDEAHVKKTKTIVKEPTKCPNCGAPITKSGTTNCEYCGSLFR
jgi:cell division protein FtsL